MHDIVFVFCCLIVVMLLLGAVLYFYRDVDSDDAVSILGYMSVGIGLLFLLASVIRKLIVMISVL